MNDVMNYLNELSFGIRILERTPAEPRPGLRECLTIDRDILFNHDYKKRSIIVTGMLRPYWK